jgi:hypothetical protein
MDFSSAVQQATFNHEISDHNIDLFQECKHILQTNYEKFRYRQVYECNSFLQCNVNA